MPWEETENEIRHRLRDPGDFEPNSFRRITLKQDRPQVFAIVGRLKGETKTTVQALRFPKSQGWTMEKAKQWVREHYKESKSIADDVDRELFTLKVPVQRLEAEIVLDSSGEERNRERRKTVTWYTGATVKRSGWEPYKLTLSMDPKHVRLDRLSSGKAPVLDSHADQKLENVIGVVERAWIERGKGYAELRFSERAEVDPIWNDIQSGIIRNASVGAAIHQLKDVTEEDDRIKSYLAVDWEPMEISIVPIGADMEAGFKAGEERATEAEIVFADDDQGAISARTGGATMPEEKATDAGGKARNEQPAPEPELERSRELGAEAERNRVQSIIEVTRALGLDGSFAEEHIKARTELDRFRKLAIDERARRDKDQPRIATPAGDPSLHDESDIRRAAMSLAILNRVAPDRYKLDEAARQYANLSMLEIAKECLAAKGIRHRGLDRMAIAKLAFQSTSDFPYILENVLGKNLRAGYETADALSQWKQIAARRTAPDFKTMSELVLDSSTRLEQVPESGEFKRGALVEGKETWKLLTYGQVIAITRQVIVNDDLGAFTRVPALLGQEVAILEASTVWGIITANPNLSDGKAVFHADHDNLDAGAAISIDSIGSGIALMMKQTTPGGKTMNVAPRFLVVPVGKFGLALQYTSANYQPAEPSKINVWAGRLTPIAEARLDAASATAWYLFADPAIAPVVVYAYLEGQEGPYSETRDGFDVDGIEVKIRHDFGAGAVDFRGAVKNPGV